MIVQPSSGLSPKEVESIISREAEKNGKSRTNG
jgi:hypothetical protein